MSSMDLGSTDVKGIVITFLYMIIGLSLTPSVQETVLETTGVYNATLGWYNLTGASRTLALLIPLFWVILVLGTGIFALTKILG